MKHVPSCRATVPSTENGLYIPAELVLELIVAVQRCCVLNTKTKSHYTKHHNHQHYPVFFQTQSVFFSSYCALCPFARERRRRETLVSKPSDPHLMFLEVLTTMTIQIFPPCRTERKRKTEREKKIKPHQIQIIPDPPYFKDYKPGFRSIVL